MFLFFMLRLFVALSKQALVRSLAVLFAVFRLNRAIRRPSSNRKSLRQPCNHVCSRAQLPCDSTPPSPSFILLSFPDVDLGSVIRRSFMKDFLFILHQKWKTRVPNSVCVTVWMTLIIICPQSVRCNTARRCSIGREKAVKMLLPSLGTSDFGEQVRCLCHFWGVS